MNLQWLLSEIFHYLSHLYTSVTRPERLISVPPESREKAVADGLLFVALSVIVYLVGNRGLFGEANVRPLGLEGALYPVVYSVVIAIGFYAAWRSVGAELPFENYFLASLYYSGSFSVLSYLLSFFLLNALNTFAPSQKAVMAAAVWSVVVNPVEIHSPDFPQNWADVIAALGVAALKLYLLLIWWRGLRALTNMSRGRSAIAFLFYFSYVLLVGSVL